MKGDTGSHMTMTTDGGSVIRAGTSGPVGITTLLSEMIFPIGHGCGKWWRRLVLFSMNCRVTVSVTVWVIVIGMRMAVIPVRMIMMTFTLVRLTGDGKHTGP